MTSKHRQRPTDAQYRLVATGSFLDLLHDPEARARLQARLEAIPPSNNLAGDK